MYISGNRQYQMKEWITKEPTASGIIEASDTSHGKKLQGHLPCTTTYHNFHGILVSAERVGP